MKAIMYHYVRPGSPGFEGLKYLHFDNFCRQLDWFEQNLGFVSREDFERSFDDHTPRPGIVLTFDDAFRDHFEWVFPELARRGLWAIFYVPTGMYRTRKLLDVHRVHMLIASRGGSAALEALRAVATDAMLSDQHRDEFRKLTYARWQDDADAIEFKRALNYYIGEDHREAVLDEIAVLLSVELPDTADFYLTPQHIRQMGESGMIIGGHGVNHLVMSKLAIEQQREEIDGCFSYLKLVSGARIETFCYPYGGAHTFNADTKSLLARAGCRYALSVEPRDIGAADLASPLALPRYDCNHFPHGKAGNNLL